MKQILSGNEAIARGAYEAGVKVASAYPGTPSTELLETLASYRKITPPGQPTRRSPFKSASAPQTAQQAIKRMVPAKALEVNHKAFAVGRAQ